MTKLTIVEDGGHSIPQKPLICVICHGPIEIVDGWAEGHNAAPVKNGRCCGDCNATAVIPARMARFARKP